MKHKRRLMEVVPQRKKAAAIRREIWGLTVVLRARFWA